MKIRVKARIAQKEEKTVHIDTEYIRLDAALKLADAVQSGGHAKIVIQDGEVKVNSEVCLSRGKKIRPGDSIEFNRKIYKIENN